MFETVYPKLVSVAPFNVCPTLQTVDSTKINTFLDCPRQYFFTYVLGWRSDRPNNHLVFGQAWHEAMEHLLLNGYHEQSILEAFDKFLACYRERFPEETDELFKPKTPANAFKALIAYCEHYRSDFSTFKTLHTEIAGSVAIDSTRSIVFRMDSVCQNLQNDCLFSLEHKTKGSAFSRQWTDQWGLAFQVGTYTHVLNCLNLDLPTKGVVINGIAFAARQTTFQRVPVYRSPEHMQNWLFHARHYCDQLDREMEELIESCSSPSSAVLTAFPMNPQACTKYFGCAFYDYCSAWSNPLHHCEAPPIGFIQDHWDPLAQPAKLMLNV